MIPSVSRCPNCDAKAPGRMARRLLGLVTLVGMGGLSLTLMACYGSPCASDPDGCHEPLTDDMSVPVDLRPPPHPNNDDGGIGDGGP